MIQWKKTGKEVGKGGTTVIYHGVGTNLWIESRKRPIAHTNGTGAWDYTSYFVLCQGKPLKEMYRLRDAKAWAQKIYDDGAVGLLEFSDFLTPYGEEHGEA